MSSCSACQQCPGVRRLLIEAPETWAEMERTAAEASARVSRDLQIAGGSAGVTLIVAIAVALQV